MSWGASSYTVSDVIVPTPRPGHLYFVLTACPSSGRYDNFPRLSLLQPLHEADDPQLKALALKALDMAYKLKGAYAPDRHRIEAAPAIDPQALERIARVLEAVRAIDGAK